LTRRITDNSKI